MVPYGFHNSLRVFNSPPPLPRPPTPSTPPAFPYTLTHFTSPLFQKHTILFPLRSLPPFPPSPILFSFWGSVRKPTLQRQESPSRIRYRRGFLSLKVIRFIYGLYWTLLNLKGRLLHSTNFEPWTIPVLHWTLFWTVLDATGLFGGIPLDCIGFC